MKAARHLVVLAVLGARARGGEGRLDAPWIDFPLLEWLSFKVAVAGEYDSTPARGAQRNKFTSTAALSFRFP